MNPRMWALGATILLASGLGAVGVMTVRSASNDQAAVASDKTDVEETDGANAEAARVETCRRLARKVAGQDLTDAQLDRVVKRHKSCQAVVVDSVDGGGTSNSDPSGVSLVAAGAQKAVLGSDDDHGSFDDFEDDDGDPSGDDDSGDDDGDFEDDDSGDDDSGDDD